MPRSGNKTWITSDNMIAFSALFGSLVGGIVALAGLISHKGYGESYNRVDLEMALLGVIFANAGPFIICAGIIRANRQHEEPGTEPRRADVPPRGIPEQERRQRLSDMLMRDDVRSMILGGYKLDGYSLGIVKEQAAEEGFAFELSVEGSDHLERFPRSVTLDGVTIPVIVKRGFNAPRP
jgi:hypothetical protein